MVASPSVTALISLLPGSHRAELGACFPTPTSISIPPSCNSGQVPLSPRKWVCSNAFSMISPSLSEFCSHHTHHSSEQPLRFLALFPEIVAAVEGVGAPGRTAPPASSAVTFGSGLSSSHASSFPFRVNEGGDSFARRLPSQ